MKRSAFCLLGSVLGLAMAAGVAQSQLGQSPPGRSASVPTPIGRPQSGVDNTAYGSAPAEFGRAPSGGSADESDRSFGSDAFSSSGPGDFSPMPRKQYTVLAPDGTPEEGAFVHAFDGRPIQLISDGTEIVRYRRSQPPMRVPAPQFEKLDKVTDDAGHFESTLGMMLIAGESGYRVTTVSEIEQHPTNSVQLTAWSTLQGAVSVNGTPLKDVRVYAYWESFPHLPELRNLAPAVLSETPVLASYLTSVAVDQAGAFELKHVPHGRIRLTVGGPLNERFEPQWMSNLVWWKTVAPDVMDAPDVPDADNLLRPPMSVQDFAAIRVHGRMPMSDELLSARTRVTSASGRAVVRYLPAGLRFFATPRTAFDGRPTPTTLAARPPALTNVSQLLKRAVIWARPGGQRETAAVSAIAELDEEGDFVCYLQQGDYNIDLVWQDAVPPESGLWTTLRSNIHQLSSPADKTDVHLEDLVAPGLSQTPTAFGDMAADFGDNDFGDRAFDAREFDAGVDDLRATDVDFSPPMIERGELPVDQSEFSRASDTFGNFDPNVADGFADHRRAGSSGFDGPGPVDQANFGMPETGLPDAQLPPGLPMSELRSVGSGDAMISPARRVRPPASPLESSIASLVTDILAAGDRRTRQQLKQPLKELLLKKFDAEQQARETLVAQLTKRLAAASKQVQERAAGRERIVNEQLQRILSLPEDEFQLLSEPPNPGVDLPAESEMLIYPDPPSSHNLPVDRSADPLSEPRELRPDGGADLEPGVRQPPVDRSTDPLFEPGERRSNRAVDPEPVRRPPVDRTADPLSEPGELRPDGAADPEPGLRSPPVDRSADLFSDPRELPRDRAANPEPEVSQERLPIDASRSSVGRRRADQRISGQQIPGQRVPSREVTREPVRIEDLSPPPEPAASAAPSAN